LAPNAKLSNCARGNLVCYIDKQSSINMKTKEPSMNPSLRKLTLALSIAGLSAATPVQAQNADAIVSLSLLAWNFASPQAAYLVALNPNLWNGLIDTFTPFLSPYETPMRTLALTAAPTLKPTASAPQTASKTLSNSYTQVISFGDSMSDTGNMYQVTTKLTGWGLPMAPNVNGRFSNGPVVLEVMSNTLNKPLLNYAFGGGQSGYGGLVPVFGLQVGMLKQVQDYISNLGTLKLADSRALYVLWTGPDDYYEGSNVYKSTTTTTITSNIKQAMTTLYQRGARNFFVPLMPDLSITPSATEHEKVQANYLSNAKARSSELATSVTAMLKAFAKQYPSTKVRTFDTYTYSQQQVVLAASQGINVTTPCYDPPFMGLPGAVCAQPDQYLFWDMNHPTAAGSLVIGAAFANAAVGAALPSQ
jgi:phospholipase/lecithinase/hemolysin